MKHLPGIIEKGNPSPEPLAERRLKLAIGALFRDQAANVIVELEGLIEALIDPDTAPDPEAKDYADRLLELFPFSSIETVRAVSLILLPVIQAGGNRGLERIRELPRTAKAFDWVSPEVVTKAKRVLPENLDAPKGNVSVADWLKNPKVIEAAQKEMYRFAYSVNATTANALRRVIVEGLARGDDIRSIANGVSNISNEWAEGWRAEMVARTEVIRAHTFGTLAAWKASGLVERKVWLAAGDACPFCQELNGKTLPLDVPFFKVGDYIGAEWNGDEIVMQIGYGDVMGPPLHPNCRCTLVGELDHDALSETGDEDVSIEEVNELIGRMLGEKSIKKPGKKKPKEERVEVDGEMGVWRTIRGTRIFIADGRSMGDIIEERFGKRPKTTIPGDDEKTGDESKARKARFIPGPDKENPHKGGKWVLEDGSPVPKHCGAIPPAWTDVRVSLDPNSTVLASGLDGKGRPQRTTNLKAMAASADTKFARVDELIEKQDEIKSELLKLRKAEQDRDTSDCLFLIFEQGVRPGSMKDTGADKFAYGASTLQARHVLETDKGVVLSFPAKKGTTPKLLIEDKDVADMLKTRKAEALKNGNKKARLFPETNERKLSELSHKLDGGSFKTKDLRTRVGTWTAIQEINRLPVPKTEKEYRQQVKAVAEVVSAKLGNTPPVALQSYINPTVFLGWRQPGWELKPPKKEQKEKGGPGSGHFGHSGRPGKVGGSADREADEGEKTLKEHREWIRNELREFNEQEDGGRKGMEQGAAIIDGNLRYIRGEKGAVNMSYALTSKMTYFNHNHPSGSAFSGQDIVIFLSSPKCTTFEATTSLGTFVMFRKKETPVLPTDLKGEFFIEEQKVVLREWYDIKESLMSKYRPLALASPEDTNKIWIRHSIDICDIMAKKYNFGFTFEPNTEKRITSRIKKGMRMDILEYDYKGQETFLLDDSDIAVPPYKEPPKKEQKEKGGPGSGHFSHAGRPGKVGGSADDDGGTEKGTPLGKLIADTNKDSDSTSALLYEQFRKRFEERDRLQMKAREAQKERDDFRDAHPNPDLLTDEEREQEKVLTQKAEALWDVATSMSPQAETKDLAVRGVVSKLPENFDPSPIFSQYSSFDVSVNHYAASMEEFQKASPEVQRLAAVDLVVGQWAVSSADHTIPSLEFQQAVAEEFGLPDRALEYIQESLEIAYQGNRNQSRNADSRNKAYRQIARAMYEKTQERLTGLGVQDLTLYRGMSLKDSRTVQQYPAWNGELAHGVLSQKGKPMSVLSNPAASWSVERNIALNFGSTYDDNTGEARIPFILKARVPKENILSTPLTGSGCLTEWEVIVLGTGGEVSAWRKN